MGNLEDQRTVSFRQRYQPALFMAAFMLSVAFVAVGAITGNPDPWWLTAAATGVIALGVLKLGAKT